MLLTCIGDPREHLLMWSYLFTMLETKAERSLKYSIVHFKLIVIKPHSILT